ncbi:MAG: hypothetical protein Q8L45_07845 [Xanthomonadaceae bacterium]|nr:hypothetical protein [Xanthomonadaceae bacterium]MDP2186107.1 hypothetical protein [Xanthomonadales bacterium]MDZ4117502.1 hypothetical protein [Xanthomonadaceae bacterium]MDZ4379426.1 hypothetical protein [Xanthomonadaceae bacterium]
MKNELFSIAELESRFEMEALTAASEEAACCEDYTCSLNIQ